MNDDRLGQEYAASALRIAEHKRLVRSNPERFQEHLELARIGDATAISILESEFQLDYAKEGGRYE
jgi:hypothetical protein